MTDSASVPGKPGGAASPPDTHCRPADATTPPHAACLTAREAAAYLHLNEKKLYELANQRELPAARVGGKWLFPRALLEEWVLEQAHGGALTDRLLVTGSDDPLLMAAIAALGADQGADSWIAYSPTGTLPGLERLARRRADAAVLNWGAVEHSARQHLTLLHGFGPHRQWARVRLALREQGVLLRPGLKADGLGTLAGFDYRWAMRPPGAGTQHFLESALPGAGLTLADCSVSTTVPGERQAAALLVRAEADCAPGSRAAATEFGLGFLSLGWVALDLALPRQVLFRRLFQDLLRACGSTASRALARRLGGYELSPLGEVAGLD